MQYSETGNISNTPACVIGDDPDVVAHAKYTYFTCEIFLWFVKQFKIFGGKKGKISQVS